MSALAWVLGGCAPPGSGSTTELENAGDTGTADSSGEVAFALACEGSRSFSLDCKEGTCEVLTDVTVSDLGFGNAVRITLRDDDIRYAESRVPAPGWYQILTTDVPTGSYTLVFENEGCGLRNVGISLSASWGLAPYICNQLQPIEGGFCGRGAECLDGETCLDGICHATVFAPCE